MTDKAHVLMYTAYEFIGINQKGVSKLCRMSFPRYQGRY